ncbi:T9SS type A sorting domain-containing protein, partial [candidate division KSB1 bacterium]|nr:T9SS type A sorting domain-containing protein [candidate division KSB1 bacterium]
YCRILNRPGSPASWSTNNYQVRTNDVQQLQAISDGSVSFTTEGTIEPDKWYHVIYEVQKAPAGDTVAYYGAFKLSDENDQEIFMDYAGFDTPPLQSTAPLRIGKAGTATGPEAYPPFFKGYYDEIKIYNYPAVELLKGIVSVDNTPEIPREFELAQNYPNPFNPTTQIRFAVPEAQHVKITVYNVLGKKVTTLADKKVAAGRHSVRWDGTNEFGIQVATGIYYYKLEADNFTKIRKMLLLK